MNGTFNYPYTVKPGNRSGAALNKIKLSPSAKGSTAPVQGKLSPSAKGSTAPVQGKLSPSAKGSTASVQGSSAAAGGYTNQIQLSAHDKTDTTRISTDNIVSNGEKAALQSDFTEIEFSFKGQNLLNCLIMAEVLAKPKSLRKGRWT